MDEENKSPVAPVTPPEPTPSEESKPTDNVAEEPAPTPEPAEASQPSKEEVISEIREKAKESEVKDIRTDINGEKADLIERAESESAAETGLKPIEFGEKMKKKSPALMIILIIVVLLLLTVGGIFLFAPDLISNLFSGSTFPTPQISQSTTEEKETETIDTETKTEPEEEEEETEIADEAVKTALFNKLYDLHNPLTAQDEYSKFYPLEAGAYFGFKTSYQVSENFYPTSTLTNSDKLYIVTSLIKRDKKTTSLSSLGVKSDIYEKYEFCSQEPQYCNPDNNVGVAAEDVEKLYKEIFGGTPTNEDPTGICGRLIYSKKYNVYFSEPVGGCGGVDLINHQAYVYSYTQKGNNAYLNLAVNTINEASSIIYRTFLKHSSFYDSTSNTDLTPDESLIHSKLNSTSAEYGMLINKDNYTEFEHYRFTFEKDESGNYFFKSVKKIDN